MDTAHLRIPITVACEYTCSLMAAPKSTKVQHARLQVTLLLATWRQLCYLMYDGLKERFVPHKAHNIYGRYESYTNHPFSMSHWPFLWLDLAALRYQSHIAFSISSHGFWQGGITIPACSGNWPGGPTLVSGMRMPCKLQEQADWLPSYGYDPAVKDTIILCGCDQCGSRLDSFSARIQCHILSGYNP